MATLTPFGQTSYGFRDITGDVKNMLVQRDWKSITVMPLTSTPPTGTITVTVMGSDLGGNNTIDLSAGESSLDCSGTRAYCEITATGITAPLRIFFRE